MQTVYGQKLVIGLKSGEDEDWCINRVAKYFVDESFTLKDLSSCPKAILFKSRIHICFIYSDLMN